MEEGGGLCILVAKILVGWLAAPIQLDSFLCLCLLANVALVEKSFERASFSRSCHGGVYGGYGWSLSCLLFRRVDGVK